MAVEVSPPARSAPGCDGCTLETHETSWTHMPTPVSLPLSSLPLVFIFFASCRTIRPLMTPLARYGLSRDELSPSTRLRPVVYALIRECLVSSSAPSDRGETSLSWLFRALVCRNRRSS